MWIVIDTNIWVSGLLWRGWPWRLLRLAETGVVEICMATPMLDELAEVLHYERLQQRLRQIESVPEELVAFALLGRARVMISVAGRLAVSTMANCWVTRSIAFQTSESTIKNRWHSTTGIHDAIFR